MEATERPRPDSPNAIRRRLCFRPQRTTTCGKINRVAGAIRPRHVRLHAIFQGQHFLDEGRAGVLGSHSSLVSESGNSSVVEHRLAKAGVEGSNPFSRSNFPAKVSVELSARRGIPKGRRRRELRVASSEPERLRQGDIVVSSGFWRKTSNHQVSRDHTQCRCRIFLAHPRMTLVSWVAP